MNREPVITKIISINKIKSRLTSAILAYRIPVQLRSKKHRWLLRLAKPDMPFSSKISKMPSLKVSSTWYQIKSQIDPTGG